MSLHDLSNEIEQYNVDNTEGWGEAISFLHRESNTTETPNAFCQDADYRKEDKEVKGNEKWFLSVKLDTPPKINDEITYDGTVWKVLDFDGGKGVYDIYTTNNRRYSKSNKSTQL
jgi:hypothetical protein